MSDVLVTRDHGEPCDHPTWIGDDGYDRGAYLMVVDDDDFTPTEFWLCGDEGGCPGGREVRLRPVSRKQVREKRVKGTVYEVVPDE